MWFSPDVLRTNSSSVCMSARYLSLYHHSLCSLTEDLSVCMSTSDHNSCLHMFRLHQIPPQCPQSHLQATNSWAVYSYVWCTTICTQPSVVTDRSLTGSLTSQWQWVNRSSQRLTSQWQAPDDRLMTNIRWLYAMRLRQKTETQNTAYMH